MRRLLSMGMLDNFSFGCCVSSRVELGGWFVVLCEKGPVYSSSYVSF